MNARDPEERSRSGGEVQGRLQPLSSGRLVGLSGGRRDPGRTKDPLKAKRGGLSGRWKALADEKGERVPNPWKKKKKARQYSLFKGMA